MKLEFLAISLTKRCNSHCLACVEWQTKKDKQKKELAFPHYKKIFKNFSSSVPYLSFVGGEVFLREDLDKIVFSATQILKPKIINIATNGLLPEKINSDVLKILKFLPKKVTLMVNLSIDGIEKVHDKTRGGKGFFKKLMTTYQNLKSLKKDFPNLKIAFHTGLSNFNKDKIDKLLDFLIKLSPDSYILEPVIDRPELLKKGKKIEINPQEFKKILKINLGKIWQLNKKTPFFTRLGKICYYPFALEVMERRKPIFPCFAGKTSLFIYPDGKITPCELKTKKENYCFCHSSYCYYSSIKKAPFYFLKLVLKLIFL